MAIDVNTAINAYANANRIASGAAPATGTGTGTGFAKLLQQAGAGVVDALNKSEASSLQAVTGKADLAAVTEAITNAQVALQTVVAVRDRVIAAYQDIMKMPM
jgi:flagellar hook-basal body complex protein FliE